MGSAGSIPPPVTAAPVAATPGNTAPVLVGEGVAVVLPERLQDLARPVVLTGTVAGATPEGLTRIRTSLGDVMIDLAAQLSADKSVTLQVPAGQPPGRVQVFANGPAGAAPAAGAPGAAPAPAQQPSAAQQPAVLVSVPIPAPAMPGVSVPLLPGVLLPALVLAAAKPAAAAPSGAPALPSAPASPAPPSAKEASAPPSGGTAAPTSAPPPTQPGAAPLPATPPGDAPVQLGGDAAHRGAASPQPAPPQPSAAPETKTGTPSPDKPAPQGAAQPPAAEPETPQTPARPQQEPSQQGTPQPQARPQQGAPQQETAQPGTPRPGTPQPDTPQPRAPQPGPPPSPPPQADAPQQQTPQQQAKPQPGAPQQATPQPAPPQGNPPPTPKLPAGMPSGAPAAATPPPPAASPTPTPAAPAAPPNPPPVLVQGTTVALKVVTVAPPGAPAPPPPPPAAAPSAPAGPLLQGTVAGATPQGQPILATPQGMLVLTTQGPLPPGTQVTVELTDPLRARAAAAAPHGPEAPPPGKEWPALRHVLDALAALDPELARTLTNSILPQPNKKLGAALTFLLSALRHGDARGWLGEEAATALDRSGQSALLKQMEEEFRAPARAAADAPSEWKPYTVPMLENQTLQAVEVYVRPADGDEQHGGGEGRDAKGNRFVFEVTLSRLGPLQLDGLVRSQRFDLILRSHAPLPAELQSELTEVFANSLGSMGYAGALAFQSGARNWVKLTRAGRAGLGVTA